MPLEIGSDHAEGPAHQRRRPDATPARTARTIARGVGSGGSRLVDVGSGGQLAGGAGGFQIRDGIDAYRAVRVLDDEGAGHRGRVGADADPRIEQAGLVPEAPGGVMVAADHHDPGAGVAQPRERVVEQLQGPHRRDRPVMHITGDEDEFDPLAADDVHEVVDERALGGKQVMAVQRAAEVPVGGVQGQHADHGRQPAGRGRHGGSPHPAA